MQIVIPLALFYPGVFTILSLVGLHFWNVNRRIYKIGSQIPGPSPIPLIGDILLTLGKTHDEIIKAAIILRQVYGSIARCWVGFRFVVFLMDPNDVEVILSSHEHIDKSREYRFFKPWLGDGLLISTGEKWKSHRKLIAPAFHINVLKSFVTTFNHHSNKVVERLRKEVGKEFDVHDYMSEITVDILLNTAMGSNYQSQDGEGYDYAMAVMKMCDIINKRQTKFYYLFDTIFNMTKLPKLQEKLLNLIHGLTRKVIKTKNQAYLNNLKLGITPKPSLAEIIASPAVDTQEYTSKATGLRDDLDDIDENDVGEKRRLAFLDLMIETKHSSKLIDDTDIKEEVDTIMFEGHDTTAAGSSFVLCLLGIHQDVQDKVMAELNQIFGDSKRPATFADTFEMKYLERVILETLRLYPPVPMIARHVNRDVDLPCGHTIPAGTTVVIGTFLIHRSEEHYKNPFVFDPDHFLPENTQNRHYYSYIPFSAGPRSCVGRKYAMLKLKILLSTILRNYHVKSNLTEKDFLLQGDIILKRADGFRLEIEPRV